MSKVALYLSLMTHHLNPRERIFNLRKIRNRIVRLYKHTKKPSRYSQYLAVWEELKVKDKLTLTLHHSQLHAVLNGVQKVKCYQQTIRHKLGLPAFGMMRSKTEPCPEKAGFIKLHLTLTFNGESL